MPRARLARKAVERAPTLVWVLAPFLETSDPNLNYYNDYSQSYAEYEKAFSELGIDWHWQPVTMQNYRAVIDTIMARSTAHTPVVLNLCDGDETNGVPGLSVIRYLDEIGVRYSGADSHFYDITTSKIDMKQAFDAAGVPTSPWEVIARDLKSSDGIFDRLGSPLIVKPAISAGSMGIGVQSVVDSEAALLEQLRVLHEGYRGWDLVGGGVIAERFISGPEYTSFIIGSADSPDQSIIYPPIERVFHPSLPPTEKFLSFDRLWEIYEREAPMQDGEFLWEYQAAPSERMQEISDISWAAYGAVGGRGYGRIDLREDAATGQIYVLEVNAQCGLSEDEDYTSIGAILRFADLPFTDVVREIIKVALTARPPLRVSSRS